ncbi:hypothetical protein [Streptomyces sp. NPDC008137]|uniref:hypothetical protein n=1 Tax=Streptomyces sp. NPDC008137 TaxID=3364813 RepID=UPI0036ECA5C4
MLTSEDVDDAFDDEAFMEERFSDVQRLLLGHDPAPGPETLVLLPATRCRLTVGPHASGPFGRCFAVRLEPRADLSAACVELLLADDGSLLGLVDAGALDGWRGAIPAGLAARYLAPPAPATLALFGTGEAAWSCLLVLHHALPSLSEVHVVGLEPGRTRDFAAAAALRTGLRVRVCEDARATAARADVVATTGGHPPVRVEWLAAGALLIDQTATAAPTVSGDPGSPVTGARAFDADADADADAGAGAGAGAGADAEADADADAGADSGADADAGAGAGATLRAWPSGIRPGVWSSGGGPGVGSSDAGPGARSSGGRPGAGSSGGRPGAGSSGRGSGAGPSEAGPSARSSRSGPASWSSDGGPSAVSSDGGPGAVSSDGGPGAVSSDGGPGAGSSAGGPGSVSSGTGQGAAQPPGTGQGAQPSDVGPAAQPSDAASGAPGPVVRHVGIAPPGDHATGTRHAPVPLAEIVAGRALPRRSGSDIVHYQGGELAGWSVIAAVAGLGHAWRRDVGIPVRLGRGGS